MSRFGADSGTSFDIFYDGNLHNCVQNLPVNSPVQHKLKLNRIIYRFFHPSAESRVKKTTRAQTTTNTSEFVELLTGCFML